MNTPISTCLLLLWLMTIGRLNAQTIWTGSASSDWNNTFNWSGNVPGPGNDATIPANPAGAYFPKLTAGFNFNFAINNYGVINVESGSDITLAGLLTNQGGASVILDGDASHFTVGPAGQFQNQGIIINNGLFSNHGTLNNSPGSSFGNSNEFIHSAGAVFSNQGQFDNFSLMTLNGPFSNTGAFHNHNYLKTTVSFSNPGTFVSYHGASVINEGLISNEQTGIIYLEGEWLNYQRFYNHGAITCTDLSVFINHFAVKTFPGSAWMNQGPLQNKPCATFENISLFQNQGSFQNDGILYQEAPISPVQPLNTASSFVFNSASVSGLCQNLVVQLDAQTNAVTVTGNQVVNTDLALCAGWSFQADGNTSITFSGCDDIGSNNINVSLASPSGTLSGCQSLITVQDNNEPVLQCPDNLYFQQECGQTTIVSWALPQVSEACLATLSSNVQPGAVFPAGQTSVVYTAADASGNQGSCSFEVVVASVFALACPTDLQVAVPVGQQASPVQWNLPPAYSQCPACQTLDIPGFKLLAMYRGHRYYLRLGSEVTWADAAAQAASHGGYLAVLNDSLENVLLRNDFPAQVQQAWMGLNDEQGTGSFGWVNQENLAYLHWKDGQPPTLSGQRYGLFQPDGAWTADTQEAQHSFLMEISCYEIYETSSDPAALQLHEFPIGPTSIFYQSTDACGNACGCNFEVQVTENEVAAYCVVSGETAHGWISKVQTEGFLKESQNNGGFGNFTGTVVQSPSPGCFTQLAPGGAALSAYRYWKIWGDLNSDGDFFDEQELLAATEGTGSGEVCYQLPLPLPAGPVRVRVAMSRWGYPSPCGVLAAGEAEDYLIKFVDAAVFQPDTCNWQFSLAEVTPTPVAVALTWAGESQHCQASQFIVDWSADGVQYSAIGTVDADAGSLVYHWKDLTPRYGLNQYRIRCVLDDGSEAVSEVLTVNFTAGFSEAFLCPNPAQTEIILHPHPLEGTAASLMLTDIAGRVLWKKAFVSMPPEPIQLSVADFPNGMYLMVLKPENAQQQVLRFVVQHLK